MTSEPTALQREIRQNRPFRSRQQEATIALLKTADELRRHLSEVVGRHGITLQQYNVLRILRGAYPDPLPTLEIGERLIERVPGITRLLDRLEEKGLVRRQRCSDDRRMVHCWITDAGIALLADSDPAMDVADVEAAADLSEAEVQRLIELLGRVRHRIGPVTG